MWIIQPETLDVLIQSLKSEDYRILGPKVRDGAIILGDIGGAGELPRGWCDQQEAGYYRLEKGTNGNYFDYVVGQQSWKQFLHEPIRTLWTARREKRGLHITQPEKKSARMALVGIRPCELAAIAILDKVFMESQFADEAYQLNRQNLFIVAVNCTQPAATCFCASVNTGPSAAGGYDLLLTEIHLSGQHFFVVQTGTPKGEALLAKAPHSPADNEVVTEVERITTTAAKSQVRNLETENLREIISRNFDNPVWEQIGRKCLACANCTIVCPTCFCTTIEDVTDLHGKNADRIRRWDSCFTAGFSYIHGGSIRTSLSSRYRQWMTHKLAGWIDQFGRSGCVGCGRCITWCPVGIDITKQAEAIRNNDMVA